MYEVRHYITPEGTDPTQTWLSSLRDVVARVALVKRLNRLEQGNFGDHKYCRGGVWELRVDVGPGYRVYYAQAGKQLVLLLCGGSKSSQQVDISRACEFWQDWKSR